MPQANSHNSPSLPTRHSARSRGIHLRLPTHQPEKPAPFALHHGYCDFAQYDGVGRASASLSSATLLPSFPKYPPHPNFVIPRAVAESISACQRISQRSQRPAPKPRHPTQHPPHPNFVIPRAVAESISACQRINQRSQPPAPKPRHPPQHPPPPNPAIPRSTLRTQTSSFRAQSRNPSPPANASAREASTPSPQTPPSPAVPSAPKPRHPTKYPPPPNFVIPRAVAESISACQRINQKIQPSPRPSLDAATTRSMTVCVRPPPTSPSPPLPSCILAPRLAQAIFQFL